MAPVTRSQSKRGGGIIISSTPLPSLGGGGVRLRNKSIRNKLINKNEVNKDPIISNNPPVENGKNKDRAGADSPIVFTEPPSSPSPPPKPLDLRKVAEKYLEEAEEYVEKGERFEKEAHRCMDEADGYSKKGEDYVEQALNIPGPDAIKLYEAARDTYQAARKCLEESVRCNAAATRNYRTARAYYEAYGRCFQIQGKKGNMGGVVEASETSSSSSSGSSSGSGSEGEMEEDV